VLATFAVLYGAIQIAPIAQQALPQHLLAVVRRKGLRTAGFTHVLSIPVRKQKKTAPCGAVEMSAGD